MKILLFILAVWLLRRLYKSIRRKRIDREEYLEVLDVSEWKRVEKIRMEMEELKKVSLSNSEAFVALMELEEVKLVEYKEVVHFFMIEGDEDSLIGIPIPHFKLKGHWQRKPRVKEEKKFSWQSWVPNPNPLPSPA